MAVLPKVQVHGRTKLPITPLEPTVNLRPLLPALLVTGVTMLGMAHAGAIAKPKAAVVKVVKAPAPAKKPSLALSAYAAAFQSVGGTSLDRLFLRESPADPRYYQAGVWVHDGAPCFRCDVGPGVTAAVLAAVTGDLSDRSVAIETMDTAIRLHRLPNGSFGPPAGSETGTDIQTAIFAVHLGFSFQVLGATLDMAHRTSWGVALAGAADFLSKNGNYKWYTNGNIVLANTVAAAAAWRATGDPKYKTLYDTALAFALTPSQIRWPGRGLVRTVPASATDPSHGAGYLTEEGPGLPGFDADYTQMQADFAAILFVITGEARALDLTNLLVNQLLPRVNQTTWMLDTSAGSRRPTLNRFVPFTTCALAVLAGNGRPDLLFLAQAQSKAISASFAGSTSYTDIGMYQQWGSRFAPALLFLR